MHFSLNFLDINKKRSSKEVKISIKHIKTLMLVKCYQTVREVFVKNLVVQWNCQTGCSSTTRNLAHLQRIRNCTKFQLVQKYLQILNWQLIPFSTFHWCVILKEGFKIVCKNSILNMFICFEILPTGCYQKHFAAN